MIARILIIGLAAISAPAFGAPPAAVLDLSHWKLTLPYNTERAGNPDEVLQPELRNFQDSTCFHATQDDKAVMFRAACGGLGTENSKYPRSELREMVPGGKDEASWDVDDGLVHMLEIEQAITHTPVAKPHVVCAQLHDADDDVIMVRLEDKKLFVERNGAGDISLDSDYPLGEKFKLKIVASGGRIEVWYNEKQKMDWKTSRSKCYFKAGCYTQSNVRKGDEAEAYGEVAVYRLRVTHRESLP